MATRSEKLSLVSVIIPTYNRSKILRATLESVLAQTYPAIEVIVVDDGSTDDTAATVESYTGRVRYVKQANRGVEMARNKGIRVSSGDYLNFLDDDDLMMPTKIERQMEILDSQPQVGLVHCGYHYIDQDGNHMETTGRLPEGDVRKQLVWGCFPWSGGPLIRRECFDHIGEDEHRDWYGDWGMWLRIALAGYPFACVQEPLGYYRMVQGSMTDDKVADAERLVFSILDQVFANWQLPDDIVAEKNQIYGGWHFWISCRYYIGGYWDDAQRNLAATLTLRPELLEHPEDLLQLFYWDATSPRVRIYDPVKFINDIFDHLPPIAEPIHPYRSRLLSQVNIACAFQDYFAGHRRTVPQRVLAAVRHHPSLLKNRGVVSILVKSLPALMRQGS